jgi:hypothetical protein
MKFEYGVIAVLGFLIFSVIGLIANQPNEIPHWNYLQEIEQQSFEDGCNIDCKVQQEKRGHLCTEISADEYICRPPREIKYPDEEFQILTAFPPTYGEFAYFPAGVDMEERFFDITRVDLIHPITNEIRVKFVQHNLKHFINDFEYTTSLNPGQTFFSHCLGGDSKTAHLVEYRDVFVLDHKIYIEFWGSHVTMPDELLPCEMPELIQYTIPIDYSLGIDFVD